MLLVPENAPPARRQRRRYTDEYKASLVAQCQQPYVSVAAIALSHDINANLLRKWIREYGQVQSRPSGQRLQVTPINSSFIEVTPTAAPASLATQHQQSPNTGLITVELPSKQGPVRLHWPAEYADRLAVCLKVLLT